MVPHYNKCQPKDSYSLVTSIIMDIIKLAILRKSSDIFGDISRIIPGVILKMIFRKKKLSIILRHPSKNGSPLPQMSTRRFLLTRRHVNNFKVAQIFSGNTSKPLFLPFSNDASIHFLTFPACFQIPIFFSNLNHNCSNL